MSQIIVIPARLGSTRLPRKPLLEIKGRTTIQHVYEGAARTGLPTLVATDSDEIADVVRAFGGEVVITDSDLRSGTDRVAQAIDRYDPHERYLEVVNLQGDMPFVEPNHIMDCMKPLRDHSMGTVVFDMDVVELDNPNSVKAIVSWDGDRGRAHWFVRASIPYGYHHAGIYSFTRPTLRKFSLLPTSHHEGVERLEQLRALEHGIVIGCQRTTAVAGEINTPADLARANGY